MGLDLAIRIALEDFLALVIRGAGAKLTSLLLLSLQGFLRSSGGEPQLAISYQRTFNAVDHKNADCSLAKPFV